MPRRSTYEQNHSDCARAAAEARAALVAEYEAKLRALRDENERLTGLLDEKQAELDKWVEANS